jgi:hypothetical protein
VLIGDLSPHARVFVLSVTRIKIYPRFSSSFSSIFSPSRLPRFFARKFPIFRISYAFGARNSFDCLRARNGAFELISQVAGLDQHCLGDPDQMNFPFSVTDQIAQSSKERQIP